MANPFRKLNAQQVYALLTDPNNDLPTWPSEKARRNYNAMSGLATVRRTRAFIKMLKDDGAFVSDWKGLDYGAGWGRIASLLLSRGGPEQLDLVDAWDRSIGLLEASGFENRYWKVSEILKPGEIPENTYDFVYAFSVFTHLSEEAFWTNLDALKKGIRAPGTVYFTVRHQEFIPHKYPERADEISSALESQGFWFTLTRGDHGTQAVFGDTIVTKERLRRELGSIEYLGMPPGQMQHVYAWRV